MKLSEFIKMDYVFLLVMVILVGVIGFILLTNSSDYSECEGLIVGEAIRYCEACVFDCEKINGSFLRITSGGWNNVDCSCIVNNTIIVAW